MRRSVSPLTWRWRSPRCGWAACATGWTTRRALSLCVGWVPAALTSTGPVLNVLPLAVHIDARETLADLAMRLAAQLKKMRRHQRYDAEQIVRDSGKAAGDEPLFGPVLNVKVFDYQLDIDGVQAVTHTLATGPVKRSRAGAVPGWDRRAVAGDPRQQGPVRRSRAPSPHGATDRAAGAVRRRSGALRCGEAEMLSADELARLAAVNDTAVPLPATTLSALVADQARKTPDAPALADARWQFSYREMRQQVVALAQLLRQRGVKPGDSVAVALPRSVFLTLALHGIVEAGAAWLPLDTGYPDDRLRMMLEDARPSLLIATEDQLARFSDIPGLESLCYQQPLAAGDDAPLALSKTRPYRLHHLYLRLHRAAERGDGRPDRHRQPPAVDAGSLSVICRRRGGAENADAVSTCRCGILVAVYRRRAAGDGRAGGAPRPAGDAAVLRPLRRDHHPLCAVDAGGVCRLAGCRQRRCLPHAAAGYSAAAKRCRRNCAASGSA